MDYGLLNALGISLMMIFGLWAFQHGYKKRHKGQEKKPDITKRTEGKPEA